MYEAFFGFKEKPFSIIPDPSFLYPSSKHRAALDLLEYGMMNQAGFNVITGEIGTGKTTLIRHILNRMNKDVTVGLISNTHRSFGELLQWILYAYGLDYKGKEKVEMFQAFMEFLINEYANNRRTVLIVDEAQNMSPETLEELRMLSNVNADKSQVLQVVLVGQPQLRAAEPLRELLRAESVEELCFTSEATFARRVTYPLITTVTTGTRGGRTRVQRRAGTESSVRLPRAGTWLPAVEGFAAAPSHVRLGDIALRISCGVATGADSVYVMPTADIPDVLRRFSHPTVSGRQILPSRRVVLESSLLAPYNASGQLLRESALGALGEFLRDPVRLQRLTARTCTSRKPWYAYHDNLPLPDVLRPKLLCKDITAQPFFVMDRVGTLVPRHSVYYIVPTDATLLEPLSEYLNSDEVARWLRAHCQRAANGYLRMQSHVLKELPLPAEFSSWVAPVRSGSPLLELVSA